MGGEGRKAEREYGWEKGREGIWVGVITREKEWDNINMMLGLTVPDSNILASIDAGSELSVALKMDSKGKGKPSRLKETQGKAKKLAGQVS